MKKTTQRIILTLMLFSGVLISCGGGGGGGGNSGGTVVYAAGYVTESSPVACYWRNGTRTQLMDSESQAQSLTLVEGDLYISGHVVSGGNKYPCFWENDFVLYNEAEQSSPLAGNARSIIITDGNHMVSGGYSVSSSYHVAGEWQADVNTDGSLSNASRISYTTGANSGGNENSHSVVNSITTDDTGAVYYGAGYCTNADGTMVAGYWKGDLGGESDRFWYNLTLGNYGANAHDIVIDGDDNYVSGFRKNRAGDSVAGYWKNGIWTGLTTGTALDRGLTLVIDGEDIYVGGYITDNDSGYMVAGYWLNGEWTALSDGTSDAEALSLVVDGDDIYAGGYVSDDSGATFAGYWLNGKWNKLGGSGSKVFSLIVTEE